jgi:putative SOS response-associated peptidase YedK
VVRGGCKLEIDIPRPMGRPRTAARSAKMVVATSWNAAFVTVRGFMPISRYYEMLDRCKYFGKDLLVWPMDHRLIIS